MARRRDVGAGGETVALQFLQARGCTLIERNLFVEGDELDLVVDDGGRIVVVEVKTTTNGDDPLEAVDRGKAGRIRRAVAGCGLVVDRIDLIAVSFDASGATVRWLPGAL